MANTLTAVVPRLLAAGLSALRNQAFMPQIVNRKYETEAAMRGTTVDVPIPSAIPVADVSAAATPPSTGDVAPTYVAVPLDKWKEAAFYLTDKEELEIMEGVIPMQATAAIEAISTQINGDILALYKDVFGYVGTAGTTPFATDTTGATLLRKTLNVQLAPMAPRYAVIDPSAEANALGLRAFQDASWAGDAAAIREGKVGAKLGFVWAMHQLVPTHTAGTITTGLISKASTAYAVGVKTLAATTAASTGACALKTGDIITFAGDSQTYVLTADATQASAATDVTLAFLPGLKVAHTGSEAVSVKASHVANLGFHREAFAFATRPLSMTNDLGPKQMAAVDVESGLTLRFTVSYEHRRKRYAYDVLYGCKTVRPELAARLAG